MERDGVDVVVAQCSPGDWVRLGSGWWQLGQPLAGGIGARPSLDGALVADLGQRWPAILDGREEVLERIPYEHRKATGRRRPTPARRNSSERAA